MKNRLLRKAINLISRSFLILTSAIFLLGATAPNLNQPHPNLESPLNSNFGIRLSTSDDHGLTVEFSAPPFQQKLVTEYGQTCLDIRVEGAAQIDHPGWPQLPIKGTLIGIPSQAQLTQQVLQSETVSRNIKGKVCPASQAILSQDTFNSPLNVTYQRNRDELIYQKDALFPENPVEIQPAGKIRDQEVAALRFYPLQYNPLTGELKFTRRILVRINYNRPDILAQQPIRSSLTDQAFEPVFKNVLLNSDQAASWLGAPVKSWLQSQIQASLVPLPSGIKVLVDQDGWYQITYDDLKSAGAPVDSWNPQHIQVSTNQSVLAIQVSGEADGKFDPQDSIFFYGQKVNNKYTNTNVYWVYEDANPGLRITMVNGTPGAPATVPDSFLNTIHFEQDHIYQSLRPSGANNDHWYWDGLQATSSNVSKVYAFTLKNLASMGATATLRGLLCGYSGSPNQRVKAYVNNQIVLDATWPSGSVYSFEVAFPQSYLSEGSNQIIIEAPVGDGISSQTFFTNWFEVDTHQTFAAIDDKLAFSSDTPGNWEFQLTGVTTDTLQIYNITNPIQPVLMTSVSRTGTAGNYTYSFHQENQAERPKYLALTPASWIKPKPEQIKLDATQDLLSASNAADYIIITHPSLLPQAQRLADFRALSGMRLKVVDVQDVYDLFGIGDLDPLAIHDFLAYAYQNWQKPAPADVVLLGDGHYDYKNNLGYNQPILIPPYLADVDPNLGETATDNRFVTVSGSDDLPDMNIGRLPARDVTEATNMVDKIIGYQTQSLDQVNWNKKALFVADNPDSGGDFYTLSNNIADSYLPANYIKDKAYLGQNYPSGSTAKTAILNAINEGRLLVSYVGHASTQWWAYEQILTLNDIPSMKNADRLPFFIPMTCLEGYFINPSSNAQSLAESLVRAQAAGAIASFSADGLGISTGHDILDQGLFDAIFQDNITNLGPATTQAKYYFFANTSNFLDLLDTYLLFGDPATSLHTLPPQQNIKLPLILHR